MDLGGDNGLIRLADNGFQHLVRIVSLIAHHCAGSLAPGGQQGGQLRTARGLGRCQHQVQAVAQCIYDGMDLRAEAASAAAKRFGLRGAFFPSSRFMGLDSGRVHQHPFIVWLL